MIQAPPPSHSINPALIKVSLNANLQDVNVKGLISLEKLIAWKAAYFLTEVKVSFPVIDLTAEHLNQRSQSFYIGNHHMQLENMVNSATIKGEWTLPGLPF